MTSGASVLETVAPLVVRAARTAPLAFAFDSTHVSQEAGLAVTDVVVLIDRQQGGEAHLVAKGLRLHAALTVTRMLDTLVAVGKVAPDVAASVRSFIAANQTSVPAAAAALSREAAPVPDPPPRRMPYAARAALAANPAGAALLSLMGRKRTNLCVAADAATCAEVLSIADAVGPHICCLKTHADMLSGFDAGFGAALGALAARHDFLIFEDRKFADIGHTAAVQYSGGVHRIAEWAHITNAHSVPGPGVVAGLATVGLPRGRGLLLLAEMSSAGTLARGEYTAATLEMALENPGFVCGFISVRPSAWPAWPTPPGLVHMTPGVQLAAGGDALGQQYLTPQAVLGDGGSDVIIVGRGIIAAPDPAAAAQQYRVAGWQAYEDAL